MRMLRKVVTQSFTSHIRHAVVLGAATLAAPTLVAAQDVPPDNGAPPGTYAPPPAAAQPQPPSVVPAPPPDDYAAPPASRLGPTQADYATAQGNVPYGTTPRQFYFDEERRHRPRTELSVMMGSPIWFTPEHGVVDPGFSFELRIARRYGFIAPELTLGWQINWLDQDKLQPSFRRSDLTIDNFSVSAGLRFYALPDSIVTPFVSGALDLAFWHFTGDTTTVCGYYYCSEVADYDVGLGISGRAGVAFLPADRFQIEVGARVAMAFPIGPFDRTQGWVTPYLGLMGRF